MLLELLILFSAGLLGGMINTIAGGGSFITFPALIFVGVAPINANATNTFASIFGYISGTYALKEDLIACKKSLPLFIVISLVGGLLGSILLLNTSNATFRQAIPWLLLFATLLFVFGQRLNSTLNQLKTKHHFPAIFQKMGLGLVLSLVCIYGGFFNAGLGVVLLSYLVLAGYTHIHQMNAIKLLVSSIVSFTAIVLFIFNGIIIWYEGSILLVGTLVGGYVAGHFSKKVPQHYLRYGVILISCSMTAYFFISTYL